MFCSECGTKLSDGALFCPECGNRISPPASPVQPAPKPVEPVSPVQPEVPVQAAPEPAAVSPEIPVQEAPVQEAPVQEAPVVQSITQNPQVRSIRQSAQVQSIHQVPKVNTISQAVQPAAAFGGAKPAEPEEPVAKPVENKTVMMMEPEPAPVEPAQQSFYTEPVQPATQNTYTEPVQPAPSPYTEPVQPAPQSFYTEPVQPAPSPYTEPVQPAQQSFYTEPVQPAPQNTYTAPVQPAPQNTYTAPVQPVPQNNGKTVMMDPQMSEPAPNAYTAPVQPVPQDNGKTVMMDPQMSAPAPDNGKTVMMSPDMVPTGQQKTVMMEPTQAPYQTAEQPKPAAKVDFEDISIYEGGTAKKKNGPVAFIVSLIFWVLLTALLAAIAAIFAVRGLTEEDTIRQAVKKVRLADIDVSNYVKDGQGQKLYEYVYDHLGSGVSEYYHVEKEDVRNLMNDYALANLVSDKVTEYVGYIRKGTKASVTAQELEDFARENADAIRDITGYQMKEEDYTKMREQLDKVDLSQFSSDALDKRLGVSLLDNTRFFLSYQGLAILGVTALVLLILLLVVNHNGPAAGFVWGAVSFLIVGGALAWASYLGKGFLTNRLVEALGLPGDVASHLLAKTLEQLFIPMLVMLGIAVLFLIIALIVTAASNQNAKALEQEMEQKRMARQ